VVTRLGAHLGRPQELEEAHLLGQKEEERAADAIEPAGCSADAVDVLAGVIGRVVLDDPIYLGNIKTAGLMNGREWGRGSKDVQKRPRTKNLRRRNKGDMV
jgi:formylmethanofuran dehydrogenase subunit E